MQKRTSSIDASRLRAVGQELTRLADDLARAERPPRREAPGLGEWVAAVLRARRLRAVHVGGDMFGDPAWDMLLHLMKARLEGEQVFVTGLCAAAAVAGTTGIRWIAILEKKGLLVRRRATGDSRKVLVELTETAVARIERYFAAVGDAAVGA